MFRNIIMISIKVHINKKQTRIDHFLVQQFPNYTRTLLKKLIISGKISLNGSYIKKAGISVSEGDIVCIESFECSKRIITPEALKPYKQFFNDNLLYKHEHFFVINKPAGLIVHPSSNNSLVTVSDIIIDHYPEIDTITQSNRPGIIHRLDKNTSGLLLIARTALGHLELSKLFKERSIKKIYYAIVKKHPEQSSGTINLPIERHPIHKRKMTCNMFSGREAHTDYEVIEMYENCSLVKISPHTGRTHQIRVHMASLGHPVLGDTLYGFKSKHIKRQALHAHTLTFKFNGITQKFICPLPNDITKLIQKFKTNLQ